MRSAVSDIVMTIAAALWPHASSVEGIKAASAVGTSAWSRTHLMRVPGFPAGFSSASAIQPPSRPAGSVLHRPKTRGKVSNIPDRHVDLQCQPDSKCSARVPDVAKEAPNALWPLGREYPEACQRTKADTPVTIVSQTVLWRQTCSQFSSGTWSRRSAAPTEHSARDEGA